MSHFLFGRINFLTENFALDKENFCSRLKEMGKARSLHFLLEEEIRQKVISEMLEEQLEKSGTGKIDFLITESLASDTSDELISPFVESGDLKIFFSRIENLMSNISDLFQFLEKENSIEHIDLLFTEGYDCEFMQIYSDIKGLKTNILNILRKEEGFIPSLRIFVN